MALDIQKSPTLADLTAAAHELADSMQREAESLPDPQLEPVPAERDSIVHKRWRLSRTASKIHATCQQIEKHDKRLTELNEWVTFWNEMEQHFQAMLTAPSIEKGTHRERELESINLALRDCTMGPEHNGLNDYQWSILVFEEAKRRGVWIGYDPKVKRIDELIGVDRTSPSGYPEFAKGYEAPERVYNGVSGLTWYHHPGFIEKVQIDRQRHVDKLVSLAPSLSELAAAA